MSMGFGDPDWPASLHSDAENYDVYCERCQRVHKFYTYTKEDHARVISEGAKKLADEIDKRIMADVVKEYLR